MANEQPTRAARSEDHASDADDDNPLPSLRAPEPVVFDRASESVVSTGAPQSIGDDGAAAFEPPSKSVGAISSSPILVGGFEPPSSSRHVAVGAVRGSMIPSRPSGDRGDSAALTRALGTGGDGVGGRRELPLRTLVGIAVVAIAALIALSLLLFR